MENKNFDFIIIGAGPAGIFAALEMAERRPQSRVLIVDTGRAISHRACPARIDGQCKHCDPCAIVHGWAGAGDGAGITRGLMQAGVSGMVVADEVARRLDN